MREAKVTLGAVLCVLFAACTNDYDFSFGASGGATSSGGKGGTGGSASCANGEIACASGCSDVRSDPANCGACGQACPSGFQCSQSRCRCSSASSCGGPGGGVQCDGQGRCRCNGQDCRTGEVCGANGCVCNGGPGCDGGQSCCPSGCTDLQGDRANCGTCGHACADGQDCNDGHCQ